MHKIWKILTACVFITLIAITIAEAQEKPKSSTSARAMVSHIQSTGFEDNEGETAITTSQLALRWKFMSLTYKQDAYSWKDVDQLNFGDGQTDPWKRLHRIALGANFKDKIIDDWSWMAGASLTSSFENEMNDSYGGTLRGGVGYKWSDTLSFTGGMVIFTNKVRTTAFPFIGMQYKDIRENDSGWFASLGMPSNEIGYQLDTASTFRLSFSQQGGFSRLADNSSVSSRGYVETSSWKTGLYYDWLPEESLRLSFGPEFHIGRSIKFYDEYGDKFQTEDQNNAMGISAFIKYSF
jgi:hypothetical protein